VIKNTLKLLGNLFSVVFLLLVATFFLSAMGVELPTSLTSFAAKFVSALYAFLGSAWFFVFFAILWLGVGFKLGEESGWRTLAESYGSNFISPAKSGYIRGSGRIGDVSQNGSLKIAADANGVYLTTLWIFSFGHKKLFIPWRDIEKATELESLAFGDTWRVTNKLFGFLTKGKYLDLHLHKLSGQKIIIPWTTNLGQYIPDTVSRGGI
jgi:hypothetical protein